MLESQKERANKIFQKAQNLLHNDTVVCCGVSGKQIKAYSMTVIETLVGVAATTTAIFQAATSTPSPKMATTIAVFTITTLALSKFKDYFFRDWGLEENNQKILLKIEGEACILNNTDATSQLPSPKGEGLSCSSNHRSFGQAVFTGLR